MSPDDRPGVKGARKNSLPGAVPRSRISVQPANQTEDSVLERTIEENVAEIRDWEHTLLGSRSTAERIGDWIAAVAAGGPALALHFIWFTSWIAINTGLIPGIEPFDRFPFPFLTMTVSLEAIFLTLFVLASQNRMGRQSEKRSHLNLQIDLLAEREMTVVLQLLQDIAHHLEVKTEVTADQLRDLARKTDLPTLEKRMDELTDEQQES